MYICTPFSGIGEKYMLYIQIKESEPLEKALKKFKKKFEKTQVVKELRSRQAFTKKCVRLRETKKRAVYRESQKLSAALEA
jgi:small subunit ribosomal protein S21